MSAFFLCGRVCCTVGKSESGETTLMAELGLKTERKVVGPGAYSRHRRRPVLQVWYADLGGRAGACPCKRLTRRSNTQ